MTLTFALINLATIALSFYAVFSTSIGEMEEREFDCPLEKAAWVKRFLKVYFIQTAFGWYLLLLVVL